MTTTAKKEDKKGRAKVLASYYSEALNEDTPPEQLAKIWVDTSSVKIRKAVAVNCNTPLNVLQDACRLYLDEVLQNESFQLLATFTTGNEWVDDVFNAYSNPQLVINPSVSTQRVLALRRKPHVIKAMLCSENLNGFTLMAILKWCNRAPFKSVVKIPKVKSRLRELFFCEIGKEKKSEDEASHPMYDDEAIIFYLEGFITEAELTEYLSGGVFFGSHTPKTLVWGVNSKLTKAALLDAKAGVDNIETYARLLSCIHLSLRSYTKKIYDNTGHTHLEYMYSKSKISNKEEYYMGRLRDSITSLKLNLALVQNLMKVNPKNPKIQKRIVTRINQLVNGRVSSSMTYLYVDLGEVAKYVTTGWEDSVSTMLDSLHKHIVDNSLNWAMDKGQGYMYVYNGSSEDSWVNRAKRALLDEKLPVSQETRKYFLEKAPKC